MIEIERGEINWAAVRAEYMAGGVSQAALAGKYGVSVYALKKRAAAEGWAAKARGAVRAREAGPGDLPAAGVEAAGEDVQAAGVEAEERDAQASGAEAAGEDAPAAGAEAAGEVAQASGAEAAGEDAPAAGVEAVSGMGGEAQDAGTASAGGDVQAARRTRMALLQMLERAAAAIPCDATEVKTTGNGGEVRLLKLRDLTAAYKELAGGLPAEDTGGGSQVVIDV